MHRSSLIMLLLTLSACSTNSEPKPAKKPASKTKKKAPLTLVVKLEDIYNKSFVMRLPVREGEAFYKQEQNGKVRNTVSGLLSKPKAGSYSLTLTIEEWESELSNNKGTTALDLKPGVPWSGGFVSGSVYARTVTLLPGT